MSILALQKRNLQLLKDYNLTDYVMKLKNGMMVIYLETSKSIIIGVHLC